MQINRKDTYQDNGDYVENMSIKLFIIDWVFVSALLPSKTNSLKGILQHGGTVGSIASKLSQYSIDLQVEEMRQEMNQCTKRGGEEDDC